MSALAGHLTNKDKSPAPSGGDPASGRTGPSPHATLRFHAGTYDVYALLISMRSMRDHMSLQYTLSTLLINNRPLSIPLPSLPTLSTHYYDHNPLNPLYQ